MLRFTAAIGFCLALFACGGGGGGTPSLGGAPSASSATDTYNGNASFAPDAGTNEEPSPVITFSPTSIVGNQSTGGIGSYTIKVKANSPGVFNGGVVFAVVQDGQQILRQGDSFRLLAIDPVTYSVNLNSTATLPAGRYEGVFQLALCKDAACVQPYPGSPASLPYEITVSATPLMSQPLHSTQLTGYVGGANPFSTGVRIAGPSGAWTASSNAAWLKVDQATGTLVGMLPNTVPLHFDITGLTVGVYEAELLVRSEGGQSIKIVYTLQMLPPQLRLGLSNLFFVGVNGSTIPPQALKFWIDDGSIVSWTASTPSPWLTMEPSSGFTPGYLTARADPGAANLASGAYSGSILLQAPGYASKTVNTTLTLTRPTLAATPATLTMGGPKGRDAIPQAQTIALSLNTDTRKWPWTFASPLPAWVSASATSGTVDASGTPLSFSPIPGAVAPGSYSALATVRTQVHGDTVSVPVNLNLNRDQRRLLPSEWGVGFASTPGGSVLTRTLRIVDNFEAALPWTATSSAVWLTVTNSGTTGSGPGLTLSADPSLAPMGEVSVARVTLTSTEPNVEAAVIQVGLWRSEGGLTAVSTLPTRYTNLVADKIRPYVYANNGGTSIDIYNAHLGTKVGTIANISTALSDMTVAPDGSLLYALDKTSRTIVLVDLATATKVKSWPFNTANTYQPQTLLAIRTNGQDLVIAGNGDVYRNGRSVATLPASTGGLLFTASSDGRKLFDQTSGISPAGVGAYDFDYSAISGGIAMMKAIGGSSPNGASNGQDIAVNADGTALYIASGSPYSCSSLNPANTAFIASLPGGGAYPTNVEITRDGRVLCGISGWYSDLDLWVHDANGTVLKSFRLSGRAHGILSRQVVVTPDGMMVMGLTDDPKTVFVPIGPP